MVSRKEDCVHHIHVCTFSDGTSEFLAFHSSVIDFYCVVGSTATGQRHVGNEARETHRTSIHAKTFEVIVAQQFASHLSHTVNGARALNGVLRGHVVRRIGTESADRTGRKEGATVLTRNFQTVEQRANTDIPAQHGVGLGLG